MCKLLYPFLPENMRNPKGVQLLMSDPEIKKQLEANLEEYLEVCGSGLSWGLS